MALRAVGWALPAWAALVCGASAADLTLLKGADAKGDAAFGAEVDVTLMSDYIYRGVSLSARKPSAAGFVESRWHGFYVGANLQSVELPTSPIAEVTLLGGYRWERPGFTLDLNATYFWYPGETLSEGMVATSYWEYAAGVERYITDEVTLKGLVAYSPNVSGTGAWGAYAETGVEINLPPLSDDVGWKVMANAGYWRFGNTSSMLGGFPLPAHANWRLGVEFTFEDHLFFDLSYWDTSLTREDCFVFTGDTMATPGGVANPVSNPDGLRSRLCGAALVGTLTMKFQHPNK
jgi:uncharacterized protein (TIGR02001 family)